MKRVKSDSRQDRALGTAAPPVVARVLRGGRLESAHRGLAAVVSARGRLLGQVGDASRAVLIRSAAKPFQALPLLEAGGDRAFRLGDDEIALTCASHGGEPRHVRVARRLLARGGFRERDLDCGAHWPMHEPSARALARRGRRIGAVHNNCSGKHAGLLLACRLYGFSAKGYCEPSHPVHREILARLADFCGVPAEDIPIAVDGCNLPVFVLPLSALALGYARLLARSRPGETRAAAAARRRVVRAMTGSPDMVAGRGRFTTDFLRAGAGRWIGKEGAEGVYAVGVAASHSTAGDAIGIALKIEDGSSRPRDAVILALLERLGLLPDRARSALSGYRFPAVRNVSGRVVGSIEADVALEAAP
jgi:L-asparaginase II